jgi:hypothetical protein
MANEDIVKVRSHSKLPNLKSCFVGNNSCCRLICVAGVRRFIWTERPASVSVTDNGRGTITGGRTMLLNTTIKAIVASTKAITANVIAALFVRSASPAIFAVVPMQKVSVRNLCRGSLHGHPVSDSKQWCGGISKRCLCSLSRSLSRLLENPEWSLIQGQGCLTGISGRS